MGVQVRAYLTSVLDGGEWTPSRSGHLTPTDWIGSSMGPRESLDREVKKKTCTACQESKPDLPARDQYLYCVSSIRLIGHYLCAYIFSLWSNNSPSSVLEIWLVTQKRTLSEWNQLTQMLAGGGSRQTERALGQSSVVTSYVRLWQGYWWPRAAVSFYGTLISDACVCGGVPF